MLTCQELTELVTDHLEGRLSLVQRIRFRVHLGLCEHCRRYVRQMKRAVTMLGAMVGTVPQALPPETLETLRSQFREWASDSKPGETP